MTLTTLDVQPIIDAINSTIGVVVPLGIGVLASMFGLKYVRKVLAKFA